MKTLCLLMILSTSAFSAHLGKATPQIRAQAEADYAAFESENPELAADVHAAIAEVSTELKSDEEFKALMKEGLNNEAARVEATEAVEASFSKRGIKFGMVASYETDFFNAIFFGIGGGSRWSNLQFEVGPGIGAGSGWNVLTCVINKAGYNVGVNAKVVVGRGFQVGTFIGSNGICATFGYLKGFDVSLGLSSLHVSAI